MARTKHGWQRARSNSNFELLDNSAPIPQSEVITTYSSRDNDRLYFTEDNDYSAIRAASVSAPASPRLSPPTLRHPQRRGWWSSNGWSWEISAAALSLMCLAAVIAILASMNNRQLGDWKLPISVNALLSVFLTVAKTSLLVPITVCTWLSLGARA